jgi:alanyl-tRNA synthetase
VLGIEVEGRANLLVAVGSKVMGKVSALDLLKELSPLIEGKGGGKSDMAQAGGTKPAHLKDTFDKALKILTA